MSRYYAAQLIQIEGNGAQKLGGGLVLDRQLPSPNRGLPHGIVANCSDIEIAVKIAELLNRDEAASCTCFAPLEPVLSPGGAPPRPPASSSLTAEPGSAD